ncbi:MAG: ATP-binding protein [Crenarchaeota archaeon]|nr:ATP-binding protein [Thermoproteota archaeon]
MALFVDRRRELEWLDEHWRSGRAELLLVYGRRRVGKTRLVREWIRRRRLEGRIVYFVAEEEPERAAVERLSRALAETLGDELLRERPLETWRQALLYLAAAARRERLGVVIDEFQYAAQASPGLPSLLQTLWDEKLSNTRIFLLLMGSLVSFTEGLLSSRSPLYGRFTGVARLNPLTPLAAGCFAPNWSPEDRVRLYAVFGGVPGYLAEVDPRQGLWWNVERLLLRPNARFLDEARHLLKEELREVHRYFAILEAVAQGATGYGEIAQRSGVPGESLSKYLRVLEEMGLIRRVYPVLGKGRARYRLADPFLRFWFRYIPRHRAAIELGLTDKVLDAVKRDFEASLAPIAWEETLQAMIAEASRRGWIRLTPTRMGPWWHRGEEIDLVAVDETTSPPRLLAAEAKWSSLTCTELRRVLDRLRAKAQRLPAPSGARIEYLVAARHIECRNPHLLPDEHAWSINEYEKLAAEECSSADVSNDSQPVLGP